MAFVVIEEGLQNQAAGGAMQETVIDSVPGSFSESAYQIAKLALVSPATMTGVATNNVTFNFRQYRGGVLLQTVGTVTLAAGTNLAAMTEVAVPITGGTAAQVGDVFTVQTVQNGTGLAVPLGVMVKVEME